MIDCTFILRVLTSIFWLANGIVRVKFYIDWGDRLNIVIASLSFVCFVLYGASAYYHFIGL